MNIVKFNSFIAFFFLCNFFAVWGMKNAAYSGVVVYGAYYFNETLKDGTLKKTLKNDYQKSIFKLGNKEIENVNETIRNELNSSLLGFKLLPKIKFINEKKANKELKKINKKLIDTITEPIKQQAKDAAYDYMQKGIGGGVILASVYQGLRKKNTFNLKSMINTIAGTSAVGIGTACATTEIIKKNPEAITQLTLTAYSKYLEEAVLKETASLVQNSLQLTKEALKESESWVDRYAIQRLIEQKPLRETQLIVLDNEVTKKAIKEYNDELKLIIKNNIGGLCWKTIGRLSSLALVVNLINPDQTPTKFIINHFLLAASLGCTSNTSSSKKINN